LQINGLPLAVPQAHFAAAAAPGVHPGIMCLWCIVAACAQPKDKASANSASMKVFCMLFPPNCLYTGNYILWNRLRQYPLRVRQR
jgi:hypothetical protein